MKKKFEGEEGSSFVLAISLCCVCIIVMVSLAKLEKVIYIESKVQNAADASALSGAYEIATNNINFACQQARIAASKNEANLTSCEVSESSVTVVVSMKNDPRIKAKAKAMAD